MSWVGRKISWLVICAYGLGLTLPGPAAASNDALLSGVAQQIADVLGYDDASIRTAMAGEIVSHKLKNEDKKELALTLAVKVPRSAKEVFADLQAKVFFEINRTILAWGQIQDIPATAATFAELVLPDDELDKLLKIAAGSDFNLSADEIALLDVVAEEGKRARQGGTPRRDHGGLSRDPGRTRRGVSGPWHRRHRALPAKEGPFGAGQRPRACASCKHLTCRA